MLLEQRIKIVDDSVATRRISRKTVRKTSRKVSRNAVRGARGAKCNRGELQEQLTKRLAE
ncbi:hypothetical protein K0M31_001312 [Melipona bicolor]|uniref:Uncharacterized protein n=1 Tax=Melipona bicolor TaxID=60889 RepID=A0AA40KXM9_9HYME|nr:hypothetical protein K0M31_001312 [Melipona bicolor]